MSQDPLKVVQTDPLKESSKPKRDFSSRMVQQEAAFEARWKNHPGQFNPKKNAIEKLRVEKTIQLIQSHLKEKNHVLDIGCGFAPFTKTIEEKTSHITLADISAGALQRAPDAQEKCKAALPQTNFEDQSFDLILCTELLPYLHSKDLRMSISELCRLLKPSGTLILSSNIDIYSDDALDRLKKMVETEFKIHDTELTYNSWLIHLQNFFKAPKRYLEALKNPEYCRKELQKRRGFSRFWFQISTTRLMSLLYFPLQLVFSPLAWLFTQVEWIATAVEQVCHTFSPIRGMSHAILICSRRPLFDETHEPPLPDRPPFRKEVKWE